MDRPDVTLVTTGAVSVGRFRCHPSHPRFGDSGPTRGWLVVFPRTPVWITHAGRAPVLADASRAMLYNRGRYLAAHGRHEQAVSAFQQALALNPDFAPAQRALAESEQKLRGAN